MSVQTTADFLSSFGGEDPEIQVDTSVLTPRKGDSEGDDPAPLILVWKRPDTPMLYRAATDAQAVKKKYPYWPDALCLQVAVLCLCHRGPELPMQPIGFYGGLARAKNSRAWLFLVDSLIREMPDVYAFIFGGNIKNALTPSSEPVEDGGEDTPSDAQDGPPPTL